MPSSTEHLQAFSRADLIRTIQSLETDLATAAGALMEHGSKQEFAAMKIRLAAREYELEVALANLAKRSHLPRLIRWWYGC